MIHGIQIQTVLYDKTTSRYLPTLFRTNNEISRLLENSSFQLRDTS